MGNIYTKDNNPDIPEGRAMPDDLAKRVHEQLNRKRITPEDKLQDALDEMARDIVLIEPEPADWDDWVISLLEQMEREAQRRWKRDNYNEMVFYRKII